MLNTKPVKYLQSRPHHIKVLIFIFAMFTAGVVSLSFLATSLGSAFVASDVKKTIEESGIAEVTKTGNAEGHSLFENLKANISDLSGSIGSIFSGASKNEILMKGNNVESGRVKKIKPTQLPVDQQ